VPVDADASTAKLVLVVPEPGVTVKLAVGPGVTPTRMTIEPEPVAPLVSVADAVTCLVPVVVYTCTTVLTFPGRVLVSPSPKSTDTEAIAKPDVGVAVMVNVTGAFTAGLFDDAEIVTVNCGRGFTTTDCEAVAVSPKASKPVTTTRYDPAAP
jgi:hypothetical protein